MDYRRILRIIIIFVVIVAIIIGVYFLWKYLSSKSTGNLPGTGQAPTTEVVNVGEGGAIGTQINTSEQTTTQAPQTVTQKLSIFIDTPVSEYWLNSKDSSVYFSNLAGQIIKINNDGTRQLVSSQTLNNLRSITPSSDGALAIAEFNYPQLPTFSIFSASTTSWQPLPSGTVSATVSPDSKKIAYTDLNALNIIDLTTQKTTKAQDMSQVGLNLNWITNQSIFLYSDPSIDLTGYIYAFDPTAKTLKTIIDGEYGLDIKWASDGELGIKINSTDRISKLSLVDNLGNNVIGFPFKTVPEKCVFLKSTKIYCGIPKNIPSGIALPDDYYTKNNYFVDDIYEMDLPTGKITKLFDGNDVALDAYDLKMKDDNNLLFINRYDNKVYSLSLQ